MLPFCAILHWPGSYKYRRIEKKEREGSGKWRRERNMKNGRGRVQGSREGEREMEGGMNTLRQ